MRETASSRRAKVTSATFHDFSASDGSESDFEDETRSCVSAEADIDESVAMVKVEVETKTRSGRCVKSRAQREREESEKRNAIRVNNNPKLVPEWFTSKIRCFLLE